MVNSTSSEGKDIDSFFKSLHISADNALVLYGRPKVDAEKYPWVHTGAVVHEGLLHPTVEIFLRMDVDEEETKLPYFSWWVEEFTDSYMSVRLDFENSQRVSTNS